MSEEPLFRPSKRRRIARLKQTTSDDDDDNESASPRPTPLDATCLEAVAAAERLSPSAAEHDGEEDGLRKRPSVLQRRPGNKRGAGLAFTSAASTRLKEAHQDDGDSQALTTATTTITNPGTSLTEQASSRFVAPTGQVVKLDDKHMMAFIDSKLAELRAGNQSGSAANTTAHRASGMDPNNALRDEEANSAAASTPSLATATATCSNQSQAPLTASSSHIQPRPKAPRLGRDGKPFRTRKERNQPSEFDKTRDLMVEQILREAPLENIYEDRASSRHSKPSVGPQSNATGVVEAGHNVEADLLVATRFQEEFVAQREARQQRKHAAAPPAGGKNEPSRGPKLGGSRSQRAAMRAMEEASKAKK
ncbi:hypothetical protein AAFC00_005360 [Neodothiora populina]|uniref:mRNA splicing factor RNA helicase n=1 Tax=Neodothiora populina TaxID=2781224 RepID=A0ABR3PKM2_9PEZI